MDKNLVLKQFEILLILRKKEKNPNKFSIISYANFVNNIKKLDNDIISKEDLYKLPKVGAKLKTRIDELYDKGFIEEVQEHIAEGDITSTNLNYETSSNNLTMIWGLGESRAKKIIDELKITSVEELKKLPHDVLNKYLTTNQYIGLKYFDDLNKRIPHSEMTKHDNFFKKIFKEINKNIKYALVGSYRRGKDTSGDVDIIATIDREKDKTTNITELITNIVNYIKNKYDGYIIEVLVQGPKKFMGLCNINGIVRHIDIIVSEYNEYPFALMYFTGSKQFNVELRKLSLKKYELSLSQYGFKNKYTGNLIDLKKFISEKDIFEYLELNYIKPENRHENIKFT